MIWKTSVWGLIALVLVSCQEEAQKKQQPLASTEYASTRYLMEAQQLKDQLREPHSFKLIDFRKPEQFEKGHLAGALNVWRTDLADTSYRYGGMMPTKVQLEELLGRLGISPSDTIIIYDDRAAANAARLWWILKYYGHEHMAILNGGLKAWLAQGGSLSSQLKETEETIYSFPNAPSKHIVAQLSTVEQSITDPNVILLDNRSLQEFTGEILKKGAAYAGAIPSAVHLDFESAVDYSNKDLFHSADSLRKISRAVGVDGSKPVITYCQSGVRSAHTLFVLTQLLGYEQVSNYDGSWIEWSHLKQDTTLNATAER